MDPKAEQLAEWVGQVDEALASIQAEYGRRNVPDARVRFPRGFILPANTYRRSLPDFGTRVQRHNASYALMTLDVFRWVCVRTDLSGAALSMIVKEAIAILGALCEWMSKEATRGFGSRRSYTVRTARLVESGVIDTDLKGELDWIWQTRCNEHLHEVTSLEHEMYTRADYNRALAAYQAFKRALTGPGGVGEA